MRKQTTQETLNSMLKAATDGGADLCQVHAAFICGITQIEQELKSVMSVTISEIEAGTDHGLKLSRDMAKARLAMPNN